MLGLDAFDGGRGSRADRLGSAEQQERKKPDRQATHPGLLS
jgi:hypothetical protein